MNFYDFIKRPRVLGSIAIVLILVSGFFLVTVDQEYSASENLTTEAKTPLGRDNAAKVTDYINTIEMRTNGGAKWGGESWEDKSGNAITKDKIETFYTDVAQHKIANEAVYLINVAYGSSSSPRTPTASQIRAIQTAAQSYIDYVSGGQVLSVNGVEVVKGINNGALGDNQSTAAVKTFIMSNSMSDYTGLRAETADIENDIALMTQTPIITSNLSSSDAADSKRLSDLAAAKRDEIIATLPISTPGAAQAVVIDGMDAVPGTLDTASHCTSIMDGLTSAKIKDTLDNATPEQLSAASTLVDVYGDSALLLAANRALTNDQEVTDPAAVASTIAGTDQGKFDMALDQIGVQGYGSGQGPSYTGNETTNSTSNDTSTVASNSPTATGTVSETYAGDYTKPSFLEPDVAAETTATATTDTTSPAASTAITPPAKKNWVNSIAAKLKKYDLYFIARSDFAIDPLTGHMTYRTDITKKGENGALDQTIGYVSFDPIDKQFYGKVGFGYKGKNITLYSDSVSGKVYADIGNSDGSSLYKSNKLPVVGAVSLESVMIAPDGTIGGSFKAFDKLFKYDPNSKTFAMKLEFKALTNRGELWIDSAGTLSGNVQVLTDKASKGSGSGSLVFDSAGNLAFSYSFTTTGSSSPLGTVTIGTGGNIGGTVDVAKAFGGKNPLLVGFDKSGINSVGFNLGNVSGSPIGVGISKDGSISFSMMAGPVPISLFSNAKGAWVVGVAGIKITLGGGDNRPINAPKPDVSTEGVISGAKTFYHRKFRKNLGVVKVWDTTTLEADEQSIRGDQIFQEFNKLLGRNPTTNEFFEWYFYNGLDQWYPYKRPREWRVTTLPTRMEQSLKKKSEYICLTELKVKSGKKWKTVSDVSQCPKPEDELMNVNPFSDGTNTITGVEQCDAATGAGCQNSIKEFFDAVQKATAGNNSTISATSSSSSSSVSSTSSSASSSGLFD